MVDCLRPWGGVERGGRDEDSWELRGPSSRPFSFRRLSVLLALLPSRQRLERICAANSNGCSDFFDQVDSACNRYQTVAVEKVAGHGMRARLRRQELRSYSQLL